MITCTWAYGTRKKPDGGAHARKKPDGLDHSTHNGGCERDVWCRTFNQFHFLKVFVKPREPFQVKSPIARFRRRAVCLEPNPPEQQYETGFTPFVFWIRDVFCTQHLSTTSAATASKRHVAPAGRGVVAQFMRGTAYPAVIRFSKLHALVTCHHAPWCLGSVAGFVGASVDHVIRARSPIRVIW